MRRRLARPLQGLLVGLLLSGPAQARVVDRIAAVVNKDVITLSEVYDMGSDFIESRTSGEGPDGPQRREAELEVLDSLVQRTLIDQEITRLDLAVTRDELERTLDDIGRQNELDRQQLKAEIERSGYEWAAYRKELEENIRQMKFSQVVIRPRVQVTDDEVLDLYKRRINDLEGAGGARVVQGILLPWSGDDVDAHAETALAAQEVADRASEADWNELVAEFPDSPFYQARGEMGTYERGGLAPKLDAAVFSIPVGQVSAPIALDSGVIVIRVDSEEPGVVPGLDDVRDDLEQELISQKMDREMEIWYSQARRQATVDVKLETP